MTMPMVFAAALGIWFAATTAILVIESRLSRSIVDFRLFSSSRTYSFTQLHAHSRIALPFWGQQPAIARQTYAARPAYRKPDMGLQITRSLLRTAAFAFGLGVTLPTLAQTINGSSLDISGKSILQGDVLVCSGHPWIDVRCNGAAADGSHDDTAP
jgi:hypothetical protein